MYSSSPSTPPPSAPIYQSRSNRICSSSHSRASIPSAPSPPSEPGDVPRRGVGASHLLLREPLDPPGEGGRRGVASHDAFGMRTLGMSSPLRLRSERGVASQPLRSPPLSRPLSRRSRSRLSWGRSRFNRCWKSPRPRGPSFRRSSLAVMPSARKCQEIGTLRAYRKLTSSTSAFLQFLSRHVRQTTGMRGGLLTSLPEMECPRSRH